MALIKREADEILYVKAEPGVPLMNDLIAEKFQKDIFSKDVVRDLFERLDVWDLYKTFFKRKFNLYCEEKKKVQHRKVTSNQDDEELLLKRFIYNYSLAALWVLLSHKEFSGLQCEGQQNLKKDLKIFLKEVSKSKEKTGIINNVISQRKTLVPNFVHRSFAEYFAASWFAENYETNKVLIERITIDPAFKVVIEMFSRSLAEGFPLHVAVLNRNLEETKRILSFQSEVNAPDNGGRTALHLAVIFSATDRHPHWSDIIKCLVQEHKADLDIPDKVLGWRPLQYAVRLRAWDAFDFFLTEPSLLSDQDSWPKPVAQLMLDAARYASVQVVSFLVEKCGGRLESQGAKGETMVHAAATGGNIETLKYLTSKGLALEVEDNQENTALRYASPEGLSYLLENGLDLEKGNSQNMTALLEAAQDGDYDAMSVLLAKKASYEVSKSGKNMAARCNAALLCAAFAGNLESAKKLVEMGASVSQKDKKKNIAAMIATHQKHIEVAKWLLDKEKDNGDTPLVAACRRGEHKTVSFILSRGVVINGKGHDGETALIVAAAAGHEDVVKLLVDNGASMDCGDKEGKTPLHNAVLSGNREMMNLLLALGASVKCCDNEGRSPLYCAAYFGKCDMVYLLLDKGASLECPDNQGITPLHNAARRGKPGLLKLLLDKNARVESRDINGMTPLHYAVRAGKCDAMKLLLNNGAHLESCDSEGKTPLHIAALRGRCALVKQLLLRGARMERPDATGKTPLLNAALTGKCTVMKLLLEKGANAVCRDKEKRTPLHYLALFDILSQVPKNAQGSNEEDMTPDQVGELDIVKLLFEKGASVVSRDNVGRTPLHFAALRGKFEVAKLLVDMGASVECRDTEGKTPLNSAALCGKFEVAKLLVELGASVECRDNGGNTTLHSAAVSGNCDVLKLLFNAGGSVVCHNKMGKTPLHYAAQSGSCDAVTLLLEMGASVECRNRKGSTPLHFAALSGNCDVVKVLLDNGARLECYNKEGTTPLHNAALSCRCDVVQLLLDNGASVEWRDSRGRTPLHSVVWPKDKFKNFHDLETEKVVALLMRYGGEVNAVDKRGKTPFDAAVKTSDQEILRAVGAVSGSEMV